VPVVVRAARPATVWRKAFSCRWKRSESEDGRILCISHLYATVSERILEGVEKRGGGRKHTDLRVGFDFIAGGFPAVMGFGEDVLPFLELGAKL